LKNTKKKNMQVAKIHQEHVFWIFYFYLILENILKNMVKKLGYDNIILIKIIDWSIIADIQQGCNNTWSSTYYMVENILNNDDKIKQTLIWNDIWDSYKNK
jgi:hypothetical protein